jgi:hypothetical protein
MSKKSFSTEILVDQTPQEVFNAINNVRGWWSENIQGDANNLHTEFTNRYKDVHYCKMKITELIPNEKVVWHVLESEFNFTKNKNEWEGNDIVFEITKKGGQTQIEFTQHGLTPDYECYNVCHDAWTGYITNSLYNLIVKRKGHPTPKEEDNRLDGGIN